MSSSLVANARAGEQRGKGGPSSVLFMLNDLSAIQGKMSSRQFGDIGSGTQRQGPAVIILECCRCTDGV